MKRAIRREAGFSLIELLTIITTLGVLAGMSIQVYHLYERRAYDSASDVLLNKVRIALEAGRIEASGPRWYWTWANTAGPVGEAYLPGLTNSPHMEMRIQRDGFCELGFFGDWCMTEWAQVRHCKGQKVKSYWRMRNGVEQQWEFDAGGWPAC